MRQPLLVEVDRNVVATGKANGKPVEVPVGSFSLHMKGQLDHNAGTVDTYDADGNRLTSEFDAGADGTVDARLTNTYDADGNMLTRESDDDADGTVDRRFTYTDDDDGNRLSEEWDTDANGTVDERYTFTYDDDGNRLTREWDIAADGTVDSRCTYNPPCPPEVHQARSCPGRTCVAL
jgi:hypothetical protein